MIQDAKSNVKGEIHRQGWRTVGDLELQDQWIHLPFNNVSNTKRPLHMSNMGLFFAEAVDNGRTNMYATCMMY